MVAPEFAKYNYGETGRQAKTILHEREDGPDGADRLPQWTKGVLGKPETGYNVPF